MKKRLTGIMNDRKKPIWVVVQMMALTALLMGCAAQPGATVDGLSDEAVQQVTDDNALQQNEVVTQINNLRVLTAQDRFENGKMFEAVDGEFVTSFSDKAASVTIPDARKGESAAGIGAGDGSWGNGPLLFLDSIPDKNIYLYGYNDINDPGCGLILDMGKEQHIYAFPYRYMTNTLLAPDIYRSSDSSKLYVSCHTGGGTGVSVSELYVFQVDNNQVEPYYVDINDLANSLSDKIAMAYDAESKRVTVSSAGKEIITDSLFTIGGADGANTVPDSFYCGDQISYIIDGDSIRVSWVPTLYTQEGSGAQCYLENLVSLEADISFIYDSHGDISGFDIGEVKAENVIQKVQREAELSSQDGATAAKGDFDGDSLTDYVSVESNKDGAVLTVDFGNGAEVIKSISGSYVSWMDLNTVKAGDFNGDGRDEIVFAPIIYGSNYGGRELYIYRAEKAELIAMPLDCIKNTAVEYEQPDSLNEDYMCVGVSVVHTDNGQLLRIRRLLNAQVNSAWYVDVRWNEKVWQIENVSNGLAYGDEAVYEYTGKLSIAGRQQKCNILVHKTQEGNGNFQMNFTFLDSESGETLQQLQYSKYRDDFMPGTLRDGCRIVDVNQDGNDDIMLDLGVYGWAQLYACFVYDSSGNKFVQVPEFEEHPFPEVINGKGIILFHGKDDAAAQWVEKYQVKGNRLSMLGRLTQTVGQSGIRYTEETMIAGALVKRKENVTAKEIDDFEAWHMWT